MVFLADPAGGFSPRVEVHIERADRDALGWFEIVRKNETTRGGKLLGEHADWAAHAAAELPYRQAEEDRLLYVAATRARSMLVVSRWTGKAMYPAWGALNTFLAGATELPVPSAVTVAAVEPMTCRPSMPAAAAAQQREAHALVMQASWSATSVTAEARHIARITRSAEASADDPSNVVRTNTPAHRADAGQAWGTLVHGLLEHAMRQKAATRGDLRRLAMWLTVGEPRLRPVIEDALDTVERTARAEFWQLAKAHESSVETPFAVAESGRLTNGVIDLMFKLPEGWQIVDYKTDVAATDRAAAYEEQLKMYEHALAKVGIPSAGATIQPVRLTERRNDN